MEVGPWYEDQWFITSGLAAGDTLIVDGVMRLAPGAPVQVVEPAAKAPAPEAKAAQASSTGQDKK